VTTGPGATALTRIPWRHLERSGTSEAVHRVLAALYKEAPALPRSPKVEERLTMLPKPCFCHYAQLVLQAKK